MIEIKLLNPDKAVKLLSEISFFSIKTITDNEEHTLIDKFNFLERTKASKIKIDILEIDLESIYKNVEISLTGFSWGILILINGEEFGVILNENINIYNISDNIDKEKIKVIYLFKNQKLNNLKLLKIYKNILALNIGETPNLTSIKDLIELNNIQYLNISSYFKSKSNQVGELSKMNNLKYLNISESEFHDLDFLYDMNTLETLIIKDCKLNSINGIENCKRLNSLVLGSISIAKNFDNLSELTSLKSLYINKLECNNFNFLTNLYELEHLELSNSNIENIFPLANLKNLKYLVLKENYALKNLENIEKLEKLEVLIVGDNHSIENISPLGGLINLKKLYFAGNDKLNFLDLSFLNQLSNLNHFKYNSYAKPIDIIEFQQLLNLETLELYASEIFNIDLIQNFLKLRILKLSQDKKNTTKKIHFLSNLLKLNQLHLFGFNEITDLSPIKNLHSIEDLSISGASIEDIRPISKLFSLKRLHVWGSVSVIPDFSSLSNLISLDLSRCDLITSIKPLLHCQKLEFLNLEACIYIWDFHLLGKLVSLKTVKWNKPTSVYFVVMSTSNLRDDIDRISENIGEWIIYSRLSDNPIAYFIELVSSISKIPDLSKRSGYFKELIIYIRYRIHMDDNLLSKDLSELWTYFFNSIFLLGEANIPIYFEESLENISFQKEIESVLYHILISISEIPIIAPNLKPWALDLIARTLAPVEALPEQARKIAPAAAVFYAGIGDPERVRYWIEKGVSSDGGHTWRDRIYLALIAFHLKRLEFSSAKDYLVHIERPDSRDKAIAQIAEKMAASIPSEAIGLLHRIAHEALRFETAQKVASVPDVLSDSRSIFQLLLILEQSSDSLAELIETILENSQDRDIAQILGSLLLAEPAASGASALLYLIQTPEIAQRLAILNIGMAFFEELQQEAVTERKALAGQLSKWLVSKEAMKPEFSEIIANAFES